MKRLLVIGSVWPEPGSSAAGSRMLQLLDFFRQQDYQITFASAAVESEHMPDLQQQGIAVERISLNCSSFDRFAKALNPQMVLFDRFMSEEQYGWRVEQQCPQAIRILDTVDLHCLRHARHQAVKQGLDASDPANLDWQHEIALREMASILRCDLSLLMSQEELRIVRDVYGVDEHLLFYLPFMYPPLNAKQATLAWPGHAQRQHFVTIGNFRHAPNRDAVLYLKQTIWPLLRAINTEIELHVYGAYADNKVQQWHDEKNGFHIMGRAEDALSTLQQYRVCLAPLRFGAGMKGKLADAMLSGTPSVTTSMGAESMSGDYAWPGAVENQPKKMAQAAWQLYTDALLWQQAQQNGITIINKVFDREQHARRLQQRLSMLHDNLQQQRQQNFTGMLLRHHGMKSTMYMAKWIEEKNRHKQ